MNLVEKKRLSYSIKLLKQNKPLQRTMFDIYFIYYLEGQGRWFKSIAESEPEETYLKVMDILSILINNVVG